MYSNIYNITMFQLNENTYRLFIFILLLVVFGLVSFNVYSYVSAKNRFSVGAGFGFQIPSAKFMR